MKIKLIDFKAQEVEGSDIQYYSYQCENGDEICIEPLIIGGFYVARYDKNQLLIGEKLQAKNVFEAIDFAETLL